MATTDDNVALVQAAYAAFGRGDVEGACALAAPDIDFRAVATKGEVPAFGAFPGQDGMRQFFAELAGASELTEFSPREFHAVGDKVFALGHMAATERQTGRQWASDWCHVFTVRGGKLAACHQFFDTDAVARARRG